MRSCFFVLLFLLAVAAQASNTISIAVNDLAGQGVDQSEAAVISERLRVELINTQAFRVMERSEMKTILLEQGFQQTDCVDNSCIVRIGQLLGVEHMVMGTIGKVGSLFTISIRLVNVATGEILYTASEDCRCTIEDVLINATKNTAMKLELAIQKAIFGTLEIKSTPDSADVSINGKVIGKTNYQNDRFFPGTYRLTISKPTYTIMEKEIGVEQKKKLTLEFDLKHTQLYLDSTKNANRLQHMQALVTRQIVIGVFALAAASLGYYFNTRVVFDNEEERVHKDAYLSARSGDSFNGLYADYEQTRNQTKTDMLTRDILYGVSGAIGVGFCVSFLF
jgi:TolB-like protein